LPLSDAIKVYAHYYLSILNSRNIFDFQLGRNKKTKYNNNKNNGSPKTINCNQVP